MRRAAAPTIGDGMTILQGLHCIFTFFKGAFARFGM
jgi:hypothetical protein